MLVMRPWAPFSMFMTILLCIFSWFPRPWPARGRWWVRWPKGPHWCQRHSRLSPFLSCEMASLLLALQADCWTCEQSVEMQVAMLRRFWDIKRSWDVRNCDITCVPGRACFFAVLLCARRRFVKCAVDLAAYEWTEEGLCELPWCCFAEKRAPSLAWMCTAQGNTDTACCELEIGTSLAPRPSLGGHLR